MTDRGRWSGWDDRWRHRWDHRDRDRREPVSHFAGLVIYLIVLGVLNLLAGVYGATVWAGIIAFLNATIWVAVVLTVLNLFADLALGLPFPTSLPGVLLRGVAGAATAWYVVQLLLEVDRLLTLGIFLPLAPLAPLLYTAVFVLVIAGESIRVLTDRTRAD